MKQTEGRGESLETTPAPQEESTAKSSRRHFTPLTGATAYARAAEFREKQPAQYKRLAQIALSLHRRNGRVSITQVFEIARIEGISAQGGEAEPFKLNNTLRPAIARLLVKDYPDLDGAFELRRSLSDDAALEACAGR